ncbi:MAG: hypothetical protein V2I33_16490 [Kangiellaceae bacterium]|nr:hypothetical protein [Kangiellaceae bacterium]
MVDDISAASTGCNPLTGFTTNNFSCDVTANSIQINSGFDNKFDPGLLEFSISNIKNPPAAKEYKSFEIATYNSIGNVIDQTTTNIGVTPTIANELGASSVAKNSNVNGATNDYNF